MQKIAIVGGGLVGTSLAISLDKLAKTNNWQIDLFEANPYTNGAYSPSFDGRSSAIAYGTYLIYKELDLAQKFLENAYPIKQIEVSDRDKRKVTNMYAEKEGVEALGFMVANTWLGETLWYGLNKCENVKVHSPVKVESIEFIQAGGLIKTDTGLNHQADLIVLVDGGASGLKQKLGISDKVENYNQKAIFAGVELNQSHKNIAYERFVAGGAVALLPMQERRAAIVWTQESSQAEKLLALEDKEFLQELQKAFGARAGIFTSVSARGFYPLRLVLAKEQARKNLVLLGNAAHYLHPVAGQGYNLAIRGVRDLVKHLDLMHQQGLNLGDSTSLQKFAQNRKQDQFEVINFSHYLIKLFEQENPILDFGRGIGLGILNKSTDALSFIARKAMGIRN